MTDSNTPTSDALTRENLAATNILDILDVQPGEEVWVPVSMVRGDTFRAVKIEVKDRASVGGYEEKHAINDWETDTDQLRDTDTLNE